MSKMIKCKYERNDPKFNHARIYIMPEPKPLAESILLIDGDSFLIPIDLYSGETYVFSEYVYSQIKHIEGLMIMEKEHCKNCECAPKEKIDTVEFKIGNYYQEALNNMYDIMYRKEDFCPYFNCDDLPDDWWELPKDSSDVNEYMQYRLSHLKLPTTKIIYDNTIQYKECITWDSKTNTLYEMHISNVNNHERIIDRITLSGLKALLTYMRLQVIKDICK